MKTLKNVLLVLWNEMFSCFPLDWKGWNLCSHRPTEWHGVLPRRHRRLHEPENGECVVISFVVNTVSVQTINVVVFLHKHRGKVQRGSCDDIKKNKLRPSLESLVQICWVTVAADLWTCAIYFWILLARSDLDECFWTLSENEGFSILARTHSGTIQISTPSGELCVACTPPLSQVQVTTKAHERKAYFCPPRGKLCAEKRPWVILSIQYPTKDPEASLKSLEIVKVTNGSGTTEGLRVQTRKKSNMRKWTQNTNLVVDQVKKMN